MSNPESIFIPPLRKKRARGDLIIHSTLFLLILFTTIPATGIELSGYYKKLLINSKTLPLSGTSESYLLSLNRLRLKLADDLSERISFDIQYDNEILLGNYLDTTEFSSLLKNRQPDTYIDFDNNYINSNNVYGNQRLYRAYVDILLPAIDLRIGRQRIAWGTAMLWNPMDILNPFNPIQLERQEREGIDGALLDWNYNALSRVSLVYAKQQRGTSSAARWRSNQKGFDLSLMAGRFRDDNVAGFDFAGQISAIGIRGEITQTDSADERNFTQAVVGADYTFDNSLSLNVEIYYNGQGASDPATYKFDRFFSGDMLSLARHYLGIYSGYDITPLLQWNNYLIINLDDESVFFSPNLVYSLTDNIETSFATQIFSGSSTSEYGSLENNYFIQVLWYF